MRRNRAQSHPNWIVGGLVLVGVCLSFIVLLNSFGSGASQKPPAVVPPAAAPEKPHTHHRLVPALAPMLVPLANTTTAVATVPGSTMTGNNEIPFPWAGTALENADLGKSLASIAADAVRYQAAHGRDLTVVVAGGNIGPKWMLIGRSFTQSHIDGNTANEAAVYAVAGLAVRRAREAPPGRCVFVDAGANVGSYSMHAAASGCEHVIAVEPQRHQAGLTAMSAALNGFADRIRVVRAAVLDVSGKTIGMVSYGGGGLTTVDQATTPDANDWAQTVRFDELPGLADAIGQDGRIAMWKIDVEGAELNAIASAGSALDRVDNIVAEWGPPERWSSVSGKTPDDAVRLLESLEQAGFEMCVLKFGSTGGVLFDENSAVSLDGGKVKCTPFTKDRPNRFRELTSQKKDFYLWWSRPSFWGNEAITALKRA